MNLKGANFPPQDSFQKFLEMTQSDFLRIYLRFFTFTGVHTHYTETKRSGAQGTWPLGAGPQVMLTESAEPEF